MKSKTAKNVGCSTISDASARKECAQAKQQNTANCGKLATDELRKQCLEQKAK